MGEKASRKKSSTRALIFVLIAIVIVAGFIIVYSLIKGGYTSSASHLVFTEIMTSNNTVIDFSDGNYYDWIEIYNPTKVSIDLSKYGLTKKVKSIQWSFPEGTVIGPGEYIVVKCTSTRSEGLYTGFNLSQSGETVIYLKEAYSGKIIDSLDIPEIEPDKVYALRDGEWTVYDTPTPGFENNENGRKSYIASLSTDTEQLKITEICTKNYFAPRAADGNYYDWIEIYNGSSRDVNLNGYFLSNDEDDLYDWTFPDISIGAGQYLVIYASGLDRYVDGEVHTSFRLSNSNGSLYLSDIQHRLIDSVTYDETVKFGTVVFDDEGAHTTKIITPGIENTEAGYELFLYQNQNQTGLVINEVLLNNDFTVPTDGSRYYDWVELFNNSGETINLSDYYLTDNYSSLTKYRFPDRTVSPGEYVLVYLSGEEGATGGNLIHTSFKIGSDETYLILSDENGIRDYCFLDDLPYPYSYGRLINKAGFFYISEPTPAAPNTVGVRWISSSPSADVAQGVFDNIDSLTVALTGKGEIRYTLDGSDPDLTSAVYTEPITLTKSTVIRAVSYEPEKMQSRIVSYSYLINEGVNYPILSIVTDPDNLFDEETGIYVLGPNANPESPYEGANFYEDWERDANATLFEDGEEKFSIGCGISIFGQTGRRQEKKSFLLKFREKYGESYLRYPVFERYPEITRYDSIIVRSGSQDSKRSVFRDEFLTSLVNDSELDLMVQDYKMCILYVNGEYWGIYFLREKIDDDYLAQHYNVPAETFSLYRNNWKHISGPLGGYTDLFWYIASSDMTKKSNYEYAKNNMDLDSYIDFYIAMSYVGNRDVTNVKFYKSEELDGKWRWIFFDEDFAFDALYVPCSLEFMLNPDGSGMWNQIRTDMIRNLLKNPDFLDVFLSRYGYFLRTTFSAKSVLSRLNYFEDLVEPQIKRNCERWNFTVGVYEWYIENLKLFVNDRKQSRVDLLIEEATKLFNLSEEDVQKYFYDETPLISIYGEERL